MEYWIAYAVVLLTEFTVIARLCLRDALTAPDVALRLGLGLVVVGIGAAACYMISKTVVAISARAPIDFSFGKGFMMAKALPTTAHLLVLAGIVVPATAEWIRRYRRYRRLGPLWFALYRAEPAIALDPPGLLNGNTLFPTRLQLYRRVIEIRDGLLAIRPYLPSDESALSGIADVRREAARIASALRAREKGTPPRSAEITAPGGNDLGSDTDYLCRLADAYHDVVRNRPSSTVGRA